MKKALLLALISLATATAQAATGMITSTTITTNHTYNDVTVLCVDGTQYVLVDSYIAGATNIGSTMQPLLDTFGKPKKCTFAN